VAQVRKFDANAFYAAIEQRKSDDGLTWPQVARKVWQQAEGLNSKRKSDHPISPQTIKQMGRRKRLSAQHVLAVLTWLDLAPEAFLIGANGSTDVLLPAHSPDTRLRWDVHKVYDALNARRLESETTWDEVAKKLHCTPSQLTGMKTARYGMELHLCMRIIQSLGCSSADFIFAADW
jgi:hypothetical protein